MTIQEMALHYWEAIDAPVDGWSRSKHPKTGELAQHIYRRCAQEFGTEAWAVALSDANRLSVKRRGP